MQFGLEFIIHYFMKLYIVIFIFLLIKPWFIRGLWIKINIFYSFKKKDNLII